MTPKEKARALKNKLDAFITCDGEWDTEWQAEECIAAALLASHKDGIEEAIKAVEDAGGDNTEYHVAAIRKLENL